MSPVHSRTVGIKGTNMTCKPLGSGHPHSHRKPWKGGSAISPMLWMGKLRLGEVMSLAQTNSAIRGQSRV